MKIRLYADFGKDRLMGETVYDVRPRAPTSAGREILMAGAVVGTFGYNTESGDKLINVCLYADTIEKVREYGERTQDGETYLEAIQASGEKFGILINHEKLGITIPDFTSPVVSVRGGTVGRMAVGGHTASLTRLDKAMLDEVLTINEKNFNIAVMPVADATRDLIHLPDWGLYLKEIDDGAE